MRRTYLIAGLVLAVLMIGYLASRRPTLSANHGKLDTHLYLAEGTHQPLVVAFGGGSGGNDWERRYLKPQRDSLLAHGFAVLAIGYFKTEQSPDALDRISLNAISDTILQVARRNPMLDTGRIILLGGSKGAELVLNLASRFPHFKAVVAMAPSHVSFPALTIAANTSSWEYKGEEVPYVPAPLGTIVPAIKGDLYRAFSLMLEDSAAVKNAVIEVEKINGPILILSGQADEQWPATFMGEQLINRLSRNNYPYPYKHLIFDGGHIEPLNHMDQVIAFLMSSL